MNFESLANELFLDLFDYFDGTDLLYAFYGLNFRFNDLLYKQYRTFRFNFKSISKDKFDTICQKHLPFITDRVITLVLSNGDDTPQQIDLLFSYIPSFQQFTRLRSLSVYKLYAYEAIMKIINQCHQLSHLTHFKLDYSYLCTDRREYQSMIDNIWALPNLIRCETDVNSNIFDADYRTPTNTSSSLQSLFLSGEQIKLDQINQLFQCTPNLKHLSIDIINSDNNYFTGLFPTLTKLKTIVNMTDFSEIIFLLQNMPNLYHLDIDLNIGVIVGYAWEKLISNHLSKLKIFDLKMKSFHRSHENLQQRTIELISSFQSSFWVDKYRWFIRCFVCASFIYLCTSSSKLPTDLKKFPDLFMSTDANDDLQNFCNDIITIRENTFFNDPIPLNIHLTNIQHLQFTLPTNDRFWSIVPNLNQLYSLKLYANTCTSQAQLQALLDRAPHLYKLGICINNYELSTLQLLGMRLLQCTNTSVRELDIGHLTNWSDEQECMALIHLPLPAQCETLCISVCSCESILCLVDHMKNLRALTVHYTGIFKSNQSPMGKTDSQYRIANVSVAHRIIQWLKERLPSTYSIGLATEFSNDIQIWI